MLLTYDLFILNDLKNKDVCLVFSLFLYIIGFFSTIDPSNKSTYYDKISLILLSLKNKETMMLDLLIKYAKKPYPYEPSTAKFWDDEHISKSMLEAHLNQMHDGASRNLQFIEQSVRFIHNQAPSDQYPNLLDLGCGPGLYAERFTQKGYHVTGVDLSKRSINYAKSAALKNKQNIDYIEMNYLHIDFKNHFDVITLIYCDYAVLPKTERLLLLSKIKKALKPNGIFIFDVFTKNQYEHTFEKTSWYTSETGDFWKDGPHLCLEQHFIYEKNIRLNQYIVMDQNQSVDVYRVWDQHFDQQTIALELKEAHLKVRKIYSDVCGNIYDPNSKTLAVIASK
jgi:SAM-dependent methyltransferase